MILRIEDTDQNRFVSGAEEYIMESLAWCGIEIDEGVREGGEFGPYRQSERKEIYQEFSDVLIRSGWAYYAFDTPEELEEWRNEDLRPKTEDLNQTEDLRDKNWQFSYDGSTRMYLRNSLSMGAGEVERLIAEGVPYVVRFKFPEDEEIVMQDLIRGEVRVNTSTLDDKVLFKSDGMPTYHLANVVDDHLMKITHVIRGEEWLPSLPLHVMLYKAFGWTDTMPEFAHLPLILKPAGNGKLSKRDGDKLGFPVFPIEYKNPETGEISSGYRESGYLPEAFVNILALLGWNPGTEQEVFSMDELIDMFSLERVGKSGSRFDPDKARSLNHGYIQNCGNTELAKQLSEVSGKSRVKPGMTNAPIDIFTENDKVLKVIALVKERMNLLTDFWGQASFFFVAPGEYDEKMVKKAWKAETGGMMKQVLELLQSIPDQVRDDKEGESALLTGASESRLGGRDDNSPEGDLFKSAFLEEKIKELIVANEWGMGAVMQPLRLALVGEAKGPAVFDIMEVLGKTETISRIQQAITILG